MEVFALYLKTEELEWNNGRVAFVVAIVLSDVFTDTFVILRSWRKLADIEI